MANTSKWDKLAQELETGQRGPITFIKRGDNRIRLILPPGRKETEFFEQTFNYYQGKPSPKYLVFGLLIEQEGNMLPEEDQKKIVPILVGKKILQSLVANAKRGFELFDPEKGYGVTIVKSGQMQGTTYEVIMSRDPISVNMDDLIKPEKSLEEFAEEHTKWGQERNSPKATDEPEEESLGSPSGW